jgi:hypothetical protein
MVVLILGLVAGVSLVVGWLLNQIVLVYVALGASVAGLALIAVPVVLRWRAARGSEPEQAAAETEDVAETEEVTESVAQ